MAIEEVPIRFIDGMAVRCKVEALSPSPLKRVIDLTQSNEIISISGIVRSGLNCSLASSINWPRGQRSQKISGMRIVYDC